VDVTATSMLVGAEVWKAEVVRTVALPALSVVDISTGTRTPLSVPALDEALTVPAEMAAGVLVTVFPAASVVVIGEGVLAAIVEAATSEETIVLPAASVVVIGTVVPAALVPSVEETTDTTVVLSWLTVVLDSTMVTEEEAWVVL